MKNKEDVIKDMQEVIYQMKVDDIEENPDSEFEMFDCSACAKEKPLAGSIQYSKYRLCNDCVLLYELALKLGDFEIYALSCGRNIKLLREQIKKFSPKKVCVQNREDILSLKEEFKNIEFLYGEEGLIELANDDNYDILVVATNGIVSVRATISAIKNKKKIALANKETLVMAGDIVTKIAKENNVDIIPIDSEHSAILQCLN